MSLNIRAAHERDAEAILGIMLPIIRAGETYALPLDMSEQAALAYWMDPSKHTFVAVEGELVLGTYYLTTNQQGGGAHVCNCGFMVSKTASGRGVARAMCEHALKAARSHGYLAMQFNFVLSTNTRAIRLWESMGFGIVGRLPDAFEHPQEGFVDALVMHQTL
ncbi:MAG: N-acetyltransferase [Erythrobacter sp.]|uniref:GNAT family N-acetyltransferase n=1 Tax=Erythrobacter sp. TaxID=1042 RepID=UPI00326770C6